MRKFSYFLYENFDPDLEKENLYNPRRILGKQTDMVLSYVAGIPAFSCSYFLCRQRFGESILLQLIEAGALRREEDVLLFDSPVFLREDASVLYSQVRARAFELAAMLEKKTFPGFNLLAGRFKTVHLLRKICTTFSAE